MRPHRDNIAAPVLPPRLRWLRPEGAQVGSEGAQVGSEGAQVRPQGNPVLAELTTAGPVLVHFFDFAQLNSIRALPYVLAWQERYGAAGLVTLGIHSPRFGFTGERDALEPALDRLAIRHPVADDSDYSVWHDYGCKGWPSLFLWGQGGALRWFHFGEGEYAATESAIAAELVALDARFEPAAPLAPLRPSDAPGALVAPPSDELLPGGSVSDPWHAEREDDALEIEYAAGGAHVSVAGTGELRITLDGGEPRPLEVSGPGLYDLAVHPRHESHTLRLAADPGLEIYAVSFSAGLP